MSKGSKKPLPPIETLSESREKFLKLVRKFGATIAKPEDAAA